LLQANSSGDLGNVDLPTRNAARALVGKPIAVVELIYLLTFHGSEATLEPQRVQASVLRYLHAEPGLTRRVVRDTVSTAVAADPNHFLRGTNLADQIATIKVTPYKVTLEDLSKIWSVFFQTHYVLTSTFRSAFVLLDTEDAGQESLPVRFRGAYALPLTETRIDDVRPDTLAYAINADVEIAGHALLGANKRYMIDGAEGALQAGSTADRAIVRLPADVRAGLKQVWIVDRSPLGPDHFGTESNTATFVLLPAVQAVAHHPDPGPRKDHAISVDVVPNLVVGLDQRAALLLNRTTPPAPNRPSSYTLTARPRIAAADPLVFAARDVASGTYIYRLRVDGADSAMTIDTTNPDPRQQPYDGPTVVVP
jgi:hypothetical protein